MGDVVYVSSTKDVYKRQEQEEEDHRRQRAAYDIRDLLGHGLGIAEKTSAFRLFRTPCAGHRLHGLAVREKLFADFGNQAVNRVHRGVERVERILRHVFFKGAFERALDQRVHHRAREVGRDALRDNCLLYTSQ